MFWLHTHCSIAGKIKFVDVQPTVQISQSRSAPLNQLEIEPGVVNGSRVKNGGIQFLPAENARFFAFLRENSYSRKSVKYKRRSGVNHEGAEVESYTALSLQEIITENQWDAIA